MLFAPEIGYKLLVDVGIHGLLADWLLTSKWFPLYCVP